MFGDQLDWINNLLEDYMKDNKLAINGSDSRTATDKNKSTSSRLSFKSRK
jgi:hypothetical protein